MRCHMVSDFPGFPRRGIEYYPPPLRGTVTDRIATLRAFVSHVREQLVALAGPGK